MAYATTCYVTAYLKTYYPLEFYAASLTNAYERANDIEDFVQEVYGEGYKFLPLDINSSSWDFLVEDGAIRVGLSSIMGVGHAASIQIDNIKPVESLENFLETVDRSLCNKRAIVPLCLLGAFDSLGETRQGSYEKFFSLDKSKLEEEFYLQNTRQRMSIYEEDDIIEEAFMKHAYMSNPNAMLVPVGIEKIRYGNTFYIDGRIIRVKKIKDKNKNNMAFLTVLTGDGELDVTVFNSQYEIYKKHLKKNLIKNFELKKQKGFIFQGVREE